MVSKNNCLMVSVSVHQDGGHYFKNRGKQGQYLAPMLIQLGALPAAGPGEWLQNLKTTKELVNLHPGSLHAKMIESCKLPASLRTFEQIVFGHSYK